MCHAWSCRLYKPVCTKRMVKLNKYREIYQLSFYALLFLFFSKPSCVVSSSCLGRSPMQRGATWSKSSINIIQHFWPVSYSQLKNSPDLVHSFSPFIKIWDGWQIMIVMSSNSVLKQHSLFQLNVEKPVWVGGTITLFSLADCTICDHKFIFHHEFALEC